MKKKIIISLIILVVIILVGFVVAPKSCDYTNYAWGYVHKECDCLGIKVDNSCKTESGGPCPDAGGGNVCIGVVTGRR